VASPRKRFRCVRNVGFVCEHCGMGVRPLVNRSCRSHCPGCLWSKHLDVVPGDRAARCGGLMAPIAVRQDARRKWLIVHRCERCGAVRGNKAALDDPSQPDRFDELLRVTTDAASGKCR
jgi:hypothetical protein